MTAAVRVSLPWDARYSLTCACRRSQGNIIRIAFLMVDEFRIHEQQKGRRIRKGHLVGHTLVPLCVITLGCRVFDDH
jgi:hypothetical protein